MLYEFGTRVSVSTVVGIFTGTVYSYNDATKMYTILRDDDGITPPERRLVGSTVVIPITEAQR